VRAYDRSLRSRAERVFSAADPDLNLDLDDLHQEARRGFLLAARRLPAGVRLMAYAAPYIYGALYRAVRDLGPIVHSGRCRSFGDLCASSPRFEILTLDEERHDYEASREADAPDWLALSGALGRLSPRKRAILEWRYAGDEELKAVGERLGVSHQRASQIEREALHDLRRWLS
jgi:RNA polymerase sigma factor (sigma-70 family)